MKTNNCALWDAISEFMSSTPKAKESAIRAGKSLYDAHENARTVLTAIIGKRDDEQATQQEAKAEQSAPSSEGSGKGEKP